MRVGASNGVTGTEKSWPGGVSGQPENPPGYATATAARFRVKPCVPPAVCVSRVTVSSMV